MDNHKSHKIPGSDVECDIYLDLQPIPVIQDPENPWLPGTDWSRDGIIAKEG